MGPDDKIIIMPVEQFSALLDVLLRLAPAPTSVPAAPATAPTPEDGAAAQIERVKVQILPDGRMDAKNAARYLNRKEKTLAQWRSQGKGPRWVKNGGRIFYFQADLDAENHQG
jgi:hypothetical protein